MHANYSTGTWKMAALNVSTLKLSILGLRATVTTKTLRDSLLVIARLNQDNHRTAPQLTTHPHLGAVQAKAHMKALSRHLQGRT
jgi:hypothetical protein